VSERTASAIEVASIVVIGAALLAFGWTLLENLTRFRLPAALVLAVIGALQVAALRRDLGPAAASRAASLRRTRNVLFLLATLLALTEVLAPQRWAIGACVSAVEFALVLDLLTRLAPA
jgi:hypothetical protein